MPPNTSKNNACRCDQNCGCCLKKRPAAPAPEPGFLGKRPWLFVVAAFMLLFAVWGTMFTLAYKYQPKTVDLAARVTESGN